MKRIMTWFKVLLLLFLGILSFISYDEYIGIIVNQRESFMLLLNWYLVIPVVVILGIFSNSKPAKFFGILIFLISIVCIILYSCDEILMMAWLGIICALIVLPMLYFVSRKVR